MLVNQKFLFKKTINKILRSKKGVKFLSFFIPKKKTRKSFRWYFIKRNRILLVQKDGHRRFIYKYPGVHIKFCGRGSIIVLHQPITFFDSDFQLGDYSTIKIKSTKHPLSVKAFLNEKNTLEIDEDFSSGGTFFDLQNEPNLKVKIGKDCMFSLDVVFRVSDAHTIYESKTKKILNKPQKGITIGNHVWLGTGVFVLKNGQIGDNCIVGLHSIVTKPFNTPNSLIVGQPAKLIRFNVNWDRRNTYDFKKGI